MRSEHYIYIYIYTILCNSFFIFYDFLVVLYASYNILNDVSRSSVDFFNTRNEFFKIL